MVPGFAFATIAMIVVSLATKPSAESEAEFDRHVKVMDYAIAHPEADFHQALSNISAPEGNQTGSGAV